VELDVVEQRSVGATLGKASLDQAMKAGLIGLALVMVFLLVTYRLLGVVAIIGLLIYAVIFWGIINAIPITMTLPGIAGTILSLGMAVDANVIIFARIKEEVREGKSVRSSVDSGWRKALQTIVDANLTTFITAVILFWAATGGVRGFALTLGIGVLLSMFTEVILSRALLGILSNWSLFRNRTLLGLRATPEEAA
jgi:protein-export membrane protein SecD